MIEFLRGLRGGLVAGLVIVAAAATWLGVSLAPAGDGLGQPIIDQELEEVRGVPPAATVRRPN